MNAKVLACELCVMRVGSFGLVLYRNKRPRKFLFSHFAILLIGSFIRYKITFWELFS